MTSLLKHSSQDNILFLKHYTHSFAPTLIPSSQKFNQLHFFLSSRLIAIILGEGSSNMKNKDYLDGCQEKMHSCQEKKIAIFGHIPSPRYILFYMHSFWLKTK